MARPLVSLRFRTLLGLTLIPLLGTSAIAGTFNLDLTSTQYYDPVNSTGLWDTTYSTTGRMYAAVAAPAATVPQVVSFGDGSDGTFNDGPAQTGISVSGTIITVDTSVKSTFKFSSFNLTGTINVIGNQPLVIQVAGSTVISGTINLNGTAGGDNTGANATAAGQGISSGGNGGIGGDGTGIWPGIQPTNGSPNILPDFQGGLAGSNQNVGAADAGGGGCAGKDVLLTYNSTDGMNGAGNPNGTAGACTTTRANLAAAFESTFRGGAGGGGGGSFRTALAVIMKGGGGGGSGGAIRISSLGSISLTGSINARGGNGGSVVGDGTDCGGGGGGGSGGSVWLQTLGAVTGGTIDIRGGTGGTHACGPNDSTGGNGSRGVYRADTLSGAQAATLNPAVAADQTYTVLPLGASQVYTVLTKAISFNDGFYSFGTPTVTLGCGAGANPTVVYEGSNDGVNFENAVIGTQISDLNEYLYLRVKATFTATGATTKCITALSIPYLPRDLSSLTLRGGLACATLRPPGSSKGSPGSPDPVSIAGDGLLLFAVYRITRLRRRQSAAL